MKGITTHHPVSVSRDLAKPKDLEYEAKFNITPNPAMPSFCLQQLYKEDDVGCDVSNETVCCFKNSENMTVCITERFNNGYDSARLVLKIKSVPEVLPHNILKRTETEHRIDLPEAFDYAAKMKLKYLGSFRKSKQDLVLQDLSGHSYMMTVATCAAEEKRTSQLEIEYLGRESDAPATEQEIIDGLAAIIKKVTDCKTDFELTPTTMEKWELVVK